MKIFEIAALLMVLAALFRVINDRVLRMPTTLGMTLGRLDARIYPKVKGNKPYGVRI